MASSALSLALAPAISLILVLALGGPTIAWLRRLGAGQRVRDDGPQRHLQKEGTPTMGGMLMVGAAVVAAIATQRWQTRTLTLEMIVLLAATLAFGCIGAADDWLKIHRGRSLGLRARQKLALQVVVGIGFAFALAGRQALGAASMTPTADPLSPPWSVFWLLAIVGTSNAVNLSDGLDGLATGLCAIAAAGFGLLAMRDGNGEVAVLATALLGACLGFLFYNRHPARVFMGDVGSLALGGALAAMAAWLDNPVALIGLCLIPFLEAGSVAIQVASFKTTGKRVFKMSPIHHHFELSGWSEQKVVYTFWAVGAVAAALTVWMYLR
ncbi:MAG: phospho-N-acetylmuramoyl-pentapeptide-transferase [Armatimonadota bacterium]